MTRSVFRKPSLKKSISARTTGKYKRQVKKAFIPGYGKKGVGMLHPKKHYYNKLYNKTSIDTRKVIASHATRKNKKDSNDSSLSPMKFSSACKLAIIGGIIGAFIGTPAVIIIEIIVVLIYIFSLFG